MAHRGQVQPLSRGNIVDEINTAGGRAVTVDEETANLLDFAATLHDLSDGLFDITSGVLRRAWTFDGGTRVPTQAEIDALLPLVGWDKVQWSRRICVVPGYAARLRRHRQGVRRRPGRQLAPQHL